MTRETYALDPLNDPLDTPPAAPLSAYAERGAAELNRLMWALAGTALALSVAAAFTPVRQITVGQGQVAPEGSVLDIGHPEGGSVVEILARPGDFVRAGQPVLRLDPTLAASDLGQAQAREISLALAAERLNALMEDRAPAFEGILGADTAAIEQAQAAYQAERSAARFGWSETAAGVAQRRAEAETIRAQIAALQAQAAIERDRLEARRQLLDDGWISQAGLSELELAMAATQGELARLRGRAAEAEVALARAQSEHEKVRAERRRQWAAELAQVTMQLDALQRGAEGLEGRFARLELRAPADGVVQSLSAAGIGAVVRPGEPAVRLVPSGDSFTAEVRVAPEEISQIDVGDRAKLTVTAFDAQLHEELEGEVLRVSPTTFTDPNGQVYYTAAIKLPARVRTVRGEHKAILPGMTVRAEIIGEERSLLQSLLRPIDRALARALSPFG